MIKVNERFSFKKDYHGYRLTETYPTTNPKTKEPSISTRDTFHASLQQVASKILHESGDNVQGSIDDLISAWHHCTNTVANALKGLEGK